MMLSDMDGLFEVSIVSKFAPQDSVGQNIGGFGTIKTPGFRTQAQHLQPAIHVEELDKLNNF